MATTLYLKSSLAQISRGTNTNNQQAATSSWRAYALSTTVGSGAGSSLTASSAAGTVAGIEFVASGSILAEWISEPLGAAVTISGTISYRLCGSESNSMANGSASFLVQRLDSTGAIASTLATASHGTELSTTKAAHSFTATPTSTAFSKGDRIRIVAFVDDNATTGTMASGYTFTLNFDGDATNTADTYVQFTENLTWGTTATETKLSASEGTSGASFGYAVACSSDGSVVVVGAKNHFSTGVFTGGATYVYSGANYATETRLIPSDPVSQGEFGLAVACSSDGTKVIVGAPGAYTGGVATGAAYVYSGSNYATEKKLVASDKASGDRFGYSVACSSDAAVIAIGARNSSPGGASGAGAAYVYSGSNYATEKKLVASDKSNGEAFGFAIDCSSDSSIVVVGASQSSPGGAINAGAAYVYSGANYATEKKLVASDKAASDGFGFAVACSSDGSVVLITARDADPDALTAAGKAYVYSGSNYATETKLVASDRAASDRFGSGAACSADGSVVVVGAFGADPDGVSGAGAAYVYSGVSYGSERKLVASDKAASSFFGSSVACSPDASLIVVGAISALVGASDWGATYLYRAPFYYLTAAASDITDQSTDEKTVWTSR